MSYLIFGLAVMLITWWITRDRYKKQLNKAATLLIDTQIKLLGENRALTRQIEELKSEAVVVKSMKGEEG